MDLQYLRSATASDHEAVEGSLPLMSPELDRGVYVRSLRALYSMLRAWELWAGEHAPADLQAEVVSRRRAYLLEEDLRFFGEELPEADNGPDLLLSQGDAEFLGAMYVIEGSTLGGQHIARHVAEHLQLRPGEGNAYFRGYAQNTAAKWKTFQDILRAVPEHQTNSVVRGARDMFAAFRLWMLSQTSQRKETSPGRLA